ncbi:MAG TPA: hypothetical protein VGQ83_39460 [Polyangia bacterium]|jgi:hypothetical protein
MGADIIGWRNCSLQRELGPARFLEQVKLRAYRDAIDQALPPERRRSAQISVATNGVVRQLGYAAVAAAAEKFGLGCPECAGCAVGRGTTIGCARFVTYPLDAVFERLLFDFFVADFGTPDAICDQLYRDVIAQLPAAGTAWHTRRGADAAQGHLAALPRPLVHEQGGRRVDSAQVLQALFLPLDQPAVFVAYARFLSELLRFVEQASTARLAAHGISVAADGSLEIAATDAQDPAALQARIEAALAELDEISKSRTFAEIAAVRTMLMGMLEGALHEGWTVLTDA